MTETQTSPPDTAERRAAAHLRAVQEITPAVAHDLRAPINAMVFNIEILKETIASGKGQEPGGRERQLRYVGVLRDELARLHRALEIFLAQTSPRENRTDAIDLREPVGELAELLVGPARKQQVQVDPQLPSEPVQVTANRSHLRQALLQVGIAALIGIPRGERLTVRLDMQHGRPRLWLGGPVDPAAAPSAGAADRAGLETARQLIAELGGELRAARGSEGSQGPHGSPASESEFGFEVRW
jgi:two-component system C4-dicarboxylate transport sensor histidine kinase DctB